MKIKLILIIFLLLMFTQKAYACGCGIAIADMKVFNALKETQAYLLIDVKDNSTYDEMPFFRFVSMDKPYNVSIVFPMDQIPYDVQGKKISALDFLNSYGISDAESNIEEQDVTKLVKNVDGPLFLTSNGVLPMIPLLFFSGYGTMGVRAGGVETNAIAHFEFEGGSLDIYNVSSAQTLDEFVKSLGINVTDKVKDLVTKYSDYFVAVLKLQVPSLISEDEMNYLESCAPNALEAIQNELSQSSEISYDDLQRMALENSQNCNETGQTYLNEYISAATYANYAVNGTLVIMKFRNSSSFFYPTSIVNSYKYPIEDQKYYVKVPDYLHIDLSSSSISQVTNFGGQRWYKIGSTQEDLKGKIVSADFLVKTGDAARSFVMMMNENLYKYLMWLLLILYVIELGVPLVVLRKKESIKAKEVGLAVLTFTLGGLVLSSIVMLIKKKKLLALTYFGIWILILIIFLSTGSSLI